MNKNLYGEMVDDLFEKKPHPTKDDIVLWLGRNEWEIANSYEKDCHREDLSTAITDRDLEDKIDDKTFNLMLDTYEDRLADSEDWHYIMNSTINDFIDDMEMGVLDEDEEQGE